MARRVSEHCRLTKLFTELKARHSFLGYKMVQKRILINCEEAYEFYLCIE